eukprot:gnl/Spiro4/10070_TR5344_c0_g1_i1.p1 gnl/Spiro4/10070_TR5344_c0_g1~~gnl/Spiro4/10070_TR5344_c0_g1_i1.p1  ORF type:complete len:299 (-),score=57.85 gnl/Spiro4/10070_TR5344_c0_g1_i1:41-907(-)
MFAPGLVRTALRVGAFASIPLASFAWMRGFATTEAAPENLSASEFRKFPLVSVTRHNHDTSVYRFALGSGASLDNNVSSFVTTRAELDGKEVIRPYTPISLPTQKGTFDLLVKTYPTGTMSKHFATLKPGDKVEFKGPFDKLRYQPNTKVVGMVAGGTGLTPMLQVVRKVLSNPADSTDITLVFANHTEADILLKSELDQLQQQHSNFKVHYILSRPSDSWHGPRGRVTKDYLASILPKPSERSLIYVSGPPGMMEDVCGKKAPDYSQGPLSGMLKDLGFTESQVFKF